ncbi:MAG: flagellar hook-basal body protein [Clostridia bacterium]
MLSGFYTIASGILTRQHQIDVIGNNLTNINTPGYKTETALIGTFEQEMLIRLEDKSENNLSPSMSTSAIITDVQTLYSTGLMSETGRTLDMAINGEGFFEIAGDDGQQYITRVGQFDLDTEGYLILPGIGRVQSTSGDIQIGTDKFTVGKDGIILDAEGSEIATLSLVTVADGVDLIKHSNNMYSVQEGDELLQATGELLQGISELSNVDMNLEMTRLIAAQRGFQSCSAALQIMDSINSKAISQLGSLS